MKTVYTICLLLLLFSCGKTYDLSEEAIQEFDLIADNTSNPYHIYVVLPEAYDENRVEAYPVVYLLDGDWDYLQVGEVAKNYQQDGEKAAIVVGIGYTNENERSRDYTPTPGVIKPSGQADAFLDFIQNDLIPEIETKYHVKNTSDQRLIMGHSLGGLLATYCFITRNSLFYLNSDFLPFFYRIRNI